MTPFFLTVSCFTVMPVYFQKCSSSSFGNYTGYQNTLIRSFLSVCLQTNRKKSNLEPTEHYIRSNHMALFQLFNSRPKTNECHLFFWYPLKYCKQSHNSCFKAMIRKVCRCLFAFKAWSFNVLLAKSYFTFKKTLKGPQPQYSGNPITGQTTCIFSAWECLNGWSTTPFNGSLVYRFCALNEKASLELIQTGKLLYPGLNM